jgi:hypothetical protein
MPAVRAGGAITASFSQGGLFDASVKSLSRLRKGQNWYEIYNGAKKFAFPIFVCQGKSL